VLDLQQQIFEISQQLFVSLRISVIMANKQGKMVSLNLLGLQALVDITG
jgi:hypothetical protein